MARPRVRRLLTKLDISSELLRVTSVPVLDVWADLKSAILTDVWVRVPLPAPTFRHKKAL